MRKALIALLVLGLIAIDLTAMWWVARAIGWQWLIAILAVQFAVGVSIARRAGASAFRQLGEAARGGMPPDGHAGDAGLVALGGAVLALPDLVSDVIALTLLLPWTRSWARRIGGASVGRLIRAAGFSTTTTTGADGTTVTRIHEGSVIEGEVVRRTSDEPRANPAEDSGSESQSDFDG